MSSRRPVLLLVVLGAELLDGADVAEEPAARQLHDLEASPRCPVAVRVHLELDRLAIQAARAGNPPKMCALRPEQAGAIADSRGIEPGICTSRLSSPASVGIAPIKPLA